MNPDTTTLAEAKSWLRSRVYDGERCPCCDQLAKIYRRKINSGMAYALIVMYRTAGTAWLHKPTVLRGIGAAARDESLLRYWRLVEEDRERSGYWRVTSTGEAWIRGRITVPKYVRIYDTRSLGVDGEPITIQDALGDRFDLNELLNQR